jgi:hypothetical protein
MGALASSRCRLPPTVCRGGLREFSEDLTADPCSSHKPVGQEYALDGRDARPGRGEDRPSSEAVLPTRSPDLEEIRYRVPEGSD